MMNEVVQFLFPKLSLVHFLLPSRSQSVAQSDERDGDDLAQLQEIQDEYEAISHRDDRFDGIDSDKLLLYSKRDKSAPTTDRAVKNTQWMAPYRPDRSRGQEFRSANDAHIKHDDDEPGILDQFPNRSYSSRRSTLSLKKSDNPLQTYAPDQPNPNTIEELYTNTLPEVRNRLKHQGLRQVGFVQPLRDLNRANALSTEELFHKNRYKRMKTDPNDPHAQRHNPFSPIAYKDPSLSVFAPKQWTGEHPPPAKDDLLREAVSNLRTQFKLVPSTIYWNGRDELPPVRYLFASRFLRQSDVAQTNSTVPLLLHITVSHPGSGRTLSHLQRHIDINSGNTVQPITSGELTSITRSKLSGAFRVVVQVFLLPSSDEESTSDKILLQTHGPHEVNIIKT